MRISQKSQTQVGLFLILSIGVFLSYSFNFKLGHQAWEGSVKPVIDSPEVNSPELSLELRDSIENFGMGFLGVPYVYGGTSSAGFDCSGFVYFVYREFEIKVPRTTAQFADFGKEVAIDSVKKGDLLLFLSPTRNAIGHIGIVTVPKGMESEFIHASSYSKEMKVMISSLKQPNYTRRFVKAVTVLED